MKFQLPLQIPAAGQRQGGGGGCGRTAVEAALSPLSERGGAGAAVGVGGGGSHSSREVKMAVFPSGDFKTSFLTWMTLRTLSRLPLRPSSADLFGQHHHHHHRHRHRQEIPIEVDPVYDQTFLKLNSHRSVRQKSVTKSKSSILYFPFQTTLLRQSELA